MLEAPGATFTWHLQTRGPPCLPPPPALSPLGFLSRTQSLLCMACYAVCLVARSCPTLCNPMDCSPPGSSVPGDSPGKSTGVGCHALLQGNLSNPGMEPRPPAYRLSHQGKPMNTGVGSLSLLQGIFPTQESNQEARCGPHQLILQVRNFPHGPVVKTPSFHCRGHEFDLELKSHTPR